jgi:hypothetical protein
MDVFKANMYIYSGETWTGLERNMDVFWVFWERTV